MGLIKTYKSAIRAFDTIFALLDIPSLFRRQKQHPRGQVDIYNTRNDGFLQGSVHLQRGQVCSGGCVAVTREHRPGG